MNSNGDYVVLDFGFQFAGDSLRFFKSHGDSQNLGRPNVIWRRYFFSVREEVSFV